MVVTMVVNRTDQGKLQKKTLYQGSHCTRWNWMSSRLFVLDLYFCNTADCKKMLQDDKPRYTWCKLAHRIFLLSTGTWSHSRISCWDTKVGCSISIPSDDSRIRISALTAIASRIRSRVIYVPDLFAIRTGKEGVVSCPVLPVGTREVGSRLLPARCEHRIASVPFERPNCIRRSPAV